MNTGTQIQHKKLPQIWPKKLTDKRIYEKMRRIRLKTKLGLQNFVIKY